MTSDWELPSLTFNDRSFRLFQSYTGITDEAKLREHILDVQQRAVEVYPYPCIRGFLFATLRMTEHSYYTTMLDIMKTSKEPLKFLDVGCCFGTDIRQLILDGYPAEDITGLELRPEFIQLGHELFRDTPATFRPTIIIGDILDPAQLSPTPADPPAPLDHLKGQFDFVYVGCVLHLFDEPTVDLMISKLALLLRKGGRLFGGNLGTSDPGFRPSSVTGKWRYLHSPESLEKVFKSHGFEGEYVAKLLGPIKLASTEELIEFLATK